MNNQFDELTKGLAQSVTRRQAFRKFGVFNETEFANGVPLVTHQVVIDRSKKLPAFFYEHANGKLSGSGSWGVRGTGRQTD